MFGCDSQVTSSALHWATPEGLMIKIENFLLARNKGLAEAVELARHYVLFGLEFQIRPEIAVAQATVETDWFKFTGQVSAVYHNPAGLRWDNQFLQFASWRDGVRAHYERLSCYVRSEPIALVGGDEGTYDIGSKPAECARVYGRDLTRSVCHDVRYGRVQQAHYVTDTIYGMSSVWNQSGMPMAKYAAAIVNRANELVCTEPAGASTMPGQCPPKQVDCETVNAPDQPPPASPPSGGTPATPGQPSPGGGLLAKIPAYIPWIAGVGAAGVFAWQAGRTLPQDAKARLSKVVGFVVPVVGVLTYVFQRRSSFGYQIPEGWVQIAVPTTDLAMGSVSQAFAPEAGALFTVGYLKAAVYSDAPKLLATYKPAWEGSANPKLSAASTVQVGGAMCVHATFTGTGSGTSFGPGAVATARELYLVPYGDQAVVFALTCPKDRIGALSPAAQSVVASLHVS